MFSAVYVNVELRWKCKQHTPFRLYRRPERNACLGLGAICADWLDNRRTGENPKSTYLSVQNENTIENGRRIIHSWGNSSVTETSTTFIRRYVYFSCIESELCLSSFACDDAAPFSQMNFVASSWLATNSELAATTWSTNGSSALKFHHVNTFCFSCTAAFFSLLRFRFVPASFSSIANYSV